MEIAKHGLIGDLQTAALVALDGTIDFLCLPEFDSPTVFARLLDAERGGAFTITPAMGEPRAEQRYIRDTNVLVTRFVGDEAELEVVDFMPVDRAPGPSRIVRHLRMLRGRTRARVVCAPRNRARFQIDRRSEVRPVTRRRDRLTRITSILFYATIVFMQKYLLNE